MWVTQPFDTSTLLSIDPEPCRRVDFAQGRESFDFAQDRELVERLVEWQMDVFRQTHKGALVQIARKIEGLLSELILLQRDHAAVVCSACDSPCCGKVEYLFDEKDMIYAKVFLGQDVPRRKRKRNGGCPFLSADGCRLSAEVRPFACHRYLCSELEAEMMRKEPGLPKILNKKFRAVEALRGQHWKEYL